MAPGPLIFVAVNTSENNAGEHDSCAGSEAAHQQRHQESTESEFLSHWTENDDDNTEQYDGGGRAQHLFKRKIDFRSTQSGAEQAQRKREQRPCCYSGGCDAKGNPPPAQRFPKRPPITNSKQHGQRSKGEKIPEGLNQQ